MNKPLRKVYWKVLEHNPHSWTVGFWTKPDRSNIIKKRMVSLTEETLRKIIESETGMKHFELVLEDGL